MVQPPPRILSCPPGFSIPGVQAVTYVSVHCCTHPFLSRDLRSYFRSAVVDPSLLLLRVAFWYLQIVSDLAMDMRGKLTTATLGIIVLNR